MKQPELVATITKNSVGWYGLQFSMTNLLQKKLDEIGFGNTVRVEIKRFYKKRTDPQNNTMWSMLGDVAKQVEWYGRKLSAEEWKDVFTAAIKKLDVVPGIDGGFVVIGAHTSKMDTKELGLIIDTIHLFGSERNVVWTTTEING